MKIVIVESMEELKRELNDSSFNIYRGMADSNWKIKFSENIAIEENCNKKSYPALFGTTSNLLIDYKVLISKNSKELLSRDMHLNYRDPDIVLEVLASAQHYGYPTRLVDFTTDWKIALFFAIRENKNNDSTIWCLNKNTIPNVKAALYDEKYYFSDLVSEMFDNNLALRLLHNLKPGIFLYENQSFERIKRQKGLFLLSEYSPYETFQEQMINCSWILPPKKIIIDKSLRAEIETFLKEQNITDEYLFPKEFAECEEKKIYLESFRLFSYFWHPQISIISLAKSISLFIMLSSDQTKSFLQYLVMSLEMANLLKLFIPSFLSSPLYFCLKIQLLTEEFNPLYNNVIFPMEYIALFL